jgi:hypothetical protein
MDTFRLMTHAPESDTKTLCHAIRKRLARKSMETEKYVSVLWK